MNRILGEYEEVRAFLFLLPYRKDIWRRDALPIQKVIVDLANMTAKHTLVFLGVIPSLKDFLIKNFTLDKNVIVMEMHYNDAWPRDSVSNVVFDENNKPMIYSYGFNAYGDHLYYPWDDDETLDAQVGAIFNYPLKQVPMTTEGGNMVTDGKGTLFVVEDALLNDNRNPGMSKEEAEKLYLESTGCKQIVWIKRGLEFDETGGHIDNILAFVDAETMLLSWTDDKENEHYERVREIEKQLIDVKNLEGKKYRIIHLPVPRITYRNEDDCLGIIGLDGSFPRMIGDPVLNTYINYIAANDLIILPKYDIPEDQAALEIMKEVFPSKEIIQYNAQEASLGGGGFHCLSKHIN